MSELGYKEGQDISYDPKQADGDKEKLKQFSEEFINQKVDLILADSPESGVAALQVATKSANPAIPIVFANATRPDKIGLIKSFKSSGNNTTGVAVDFASLTAKKLEFLKRINPKITKLGVISSKVSDPTADYNLEELRSQAPKFGMTLVEYQLKSPPGPSSTQEVQKLVDSLKPGDFDAYFHPAGPVVNFPANRKILMSIGKKLKVPTVFTRDFDPNEESWLLSYGHDFLETGKQVAVIVDKVLKGTKPADIPIEYHKKNRLIIDLRAASDIGITIPDSILAIADRKIK